MLMMDKPSYKNNEIHKKQVPFDVEFAFLFSKRSSTSRE